MRKTEKKNYSDENPFANKPFEEQVNKSKKNIKVKSKSITKKDLIHNSYLPKIEVDSQTYEVRADGELLTCEPAIELPLAQRYFLFQLEL